MIYTDFTINEHGFTGHMADPERKTDQAVIVIMVSPSYVPFGGTMDKKHLSGHSMVTWHGRELPYVNADFAVYKMGKYYYDRQEKKKSDRDVESLCGCLR